ncbi:MAG: ABC transporter substrate-binding protein [Quinella sp. 3Q1]|nr:ABC transporter substrate-binding protein [Quinella sp. 3Q1]MBR3051439.1 ABC transporter substrate-binding protein [Selenomonadaceae bacterium]MBR6888820.1 ABC transporter substrate-binding protein [Selenomonadaceae bacterium]
MILAAALLMTGCGGGENQSASSGGEKTFTYGTMAYGVAMETTSTDPHNSYDGWATIRYGVGETLFKFNEHMELEPWLAESFEQVDDFTIKVKINDAATFSNGKKVDGAAVKKCLEDLIARHDRAPKDLKISAIEADGQFVTIKSSEKMPALLNYLSDPYGCIIDVDEGIKDGIAIGTGPYKAVKVTDVQVDLVKNENYWGAVKPKLDKVIVKSITDGDTLTMAMQNGELDAVQGLPYASLQLFKDGYKISQAETSRVYQAAFNFKTPELQDLNVRKAISMAIDKENFTKVLLNGNGAPAVGPFPSNLPFGNDKVHTVSYDLDGAKKLLAEAGWSDSDGDGYVDKDGKNLELRYLTYTSRQELPLLAEAAQASLKEIGIKLDVNATDNYKAFLKRGEYDIFSKAIVTAPTGDGEYYFTSHIVPGAVDNAGNYDSEQIAALENELHNTYGAEKRAELAIKMSQQVLDDCALFYASHLRMSFVMKPNVEGFTAHPSDYYEITAELDLR